MDTLFKYAPMATGFLLMVAGVKLCKTGKWITTGVTMFGFGVIMGLS